jgi:hypothetical protein
MSSMNCVAWLLPRPVAAAQRAGRSISTADADVTVTPGARLRLSMKSSKWQVLAGLGWGS